MAELGDTSGQVQVYDERLVPSIPVATLVRTVMSSLDPVMTARGRRVSQAISSMQKRGKTYARLSCSSSCFLGQVSIPWCTELLR